MKAIRMIGWSKRWLEKAEVTVCEEDSGPNREHMVTDHGLDWIRIHRQMDTIMCTSCSWRCSKAAYIEFISSHIFKILCPVNGYWEISNKNQHWLKCQPKSYTYPNQRKQSNNKTHTGSILYITSKKPLQFSLMWKSLIQVVLSLQRPQLMAFHGHVPIHLFRNYFSSFRHTEINSPTSLLFTLTF